MIKIKYNNYPDYPTATKISKCIRVSGWFVGSFLLIIFIFSLTDSEYIVTLTSSILIALHFWIQLKHDSIINSIIKRTKPQSELLQEQYVSEGEL